MFYSDIGETQLLMIDGFAEHLGVHDLWEREGGSGLYPPPSLHVSICRSAHILTLLHSEQPKLCRVLAILSAIGLNCMYRDFI